MANVKRRIGRPLHIAAVVIVIAALAVVAWSWRPEVPTPAHASAISSELPVCSGGDRAARKVTCIVDGDTGWEHGVKWRYLAIDAPEMPEHASCRAEAKKAVQARDRLRELMGQGYRVNWSGRKGTYHRALVTITLSDGRDAGEVLLKEGLAQPWPNHGNPWCN